MDWSDLILFTQHYIYETMQSSLTYDESLEIRSVSIEFVVVRSIVLQSRVGWLYSFIGDRSLICWRSSFLVSAAEIVVLRTTCLWQPREIMSAGFLADGMYCQVTAYEICCCSQTLLPPIKHSNLDVCNLIHSSTVVETVQSTYAYNTDLELWWTFSTSD